MPNLQFEHLSGFLALIDFFGAFFVDDTFNKAATLLGMGSFLALVSMFPPLLRLPSTE